MHSKEDEHTISIADMPPQGHALKPENDEKEVRRQAEERFHDHLYSKGYDKGRDDGWHMGWLDAVAALQSMNLHDAAEQLEAYRQRALDRA